MKGLRRNRIINTMPCWYGLNVDLSKVDDDKLSTLVKSRIDSFSAIKELLVTWQNSPNAESRKVEKLHS
jgi:hypothetical protein